MKTEEIFEKSVDIMKNIFTSEKIKECIQRAQGRTEEENYELLNRQRANINDLVMKIVNSGGSTESLKEASQELLDAVVMRYFRNRDIFVRTFPNGLTDVYPDPLSIWASIMISPQDVERKYWQK